MDFCLVAFPCGGILMFSSDFCKEEKKILAPVSLRIRKKRVSTCRKCKHTLKNLSPKLILNCHAKNNNMQLKYSINFSNSLTYGNRKLSFLSLFPQTNKKKSLHWNEWRNAINRGIKMQWQKLCDRSICGECVCHALQLISDKSKNTKWIYFFFFIDLYGYLLCIHVYFLVVPVKTSSINSPPIYHL